MTWDGLFSNYRISFMILNEYIRQFCSDYRSDDQVYSFNVFTSELTLLCPPVESNEKELLPRTFDFTDTLFSKSSVKHLR